MRNLAIPALLVAALPAVTSAELVPRTTFAEEIGYVG